MRFLSALVVLASLVACGKASHQSESSLNSNGAFAVGGSGFEAFKSGFYQFANTQNCKKCHGSIVSPKFAAPDASLAYNEAKPLLNMSNPASSVFAVYAGNGHCGDTPCSNPDNTAVVQGLLVQWAAGESSSGSSGGGGGGGAINPKYKTASVTIPNTIANYDAAANASTPLRFQINQINPATGLAKFNTAILEVEVRYTGPSQTHYRFTNLKIYATNQAGQNATITGLHLYIRGANEMGIGAEDTQQTSPWNNIGKPNALVAPIQVRPANLPTGPVNVPVFSNLAVIYPKIGPGDVITIGIEDLQ